MRNTEVLIVGGGPSGAACAWKLAQHHVDFIVLDKAEFPRIKPCAGWITPQVLKDLKIEPQDYPLGITHFKSFQVDIKGFHFKLKTNQYAIRRIEFDNWLLQRSNPQVINHMVKEITYEDGRYIIDGKFSGKYLVGAGGTHCPVYRNFFKSEIDNNKGALVVAQEEEFAYDYRDDRCYLWFLNDGLPGYSWYVPKAGGFVNIGVGGMEATFKANDDRLKRHWDLLIENADRLGLVRGHNYKPMGHSYYLRSKNLQIRLKNAFIVGDSIGLATRDMGEGISPAIQSGLRAAEAIIFGNEYTVKSIQKFSFPSLLGFR